MPASGWRGVVLMISLFLGWCGFVISFASTKQQATTSSRFDPCLSPTEPRIRIESTRLQIQPFGSSGTNDNEERQSSWSEWMQFGRRRGVGEVKHRDPIDLGGLQRSDRYAAKDWLHNTITLPNSRVLRDIRFPVISMASWATFVSLLHRSLNKRGMINAAKHMCIPTTPHSMMVSSLGLLLVFRTNSAYQRFVEGRKIWEHIVNSSRDLYRLAVLYEKQMGVGRRRRIQSLLAAFPYLLRYRIRPNLIMRKLDDEHSERDPENSLLLYQDAAAIDTDYEAAAVATAEETTGKSRRKTRPLYYVDKRTLPWRLLSAEVLSKCVRAQNRPLWVVDRMAAEVNDVPDSPRFSARERIAFMRHVENLGACIGACERIHQTVVPLNYARHALRVLTLWLLSLPFALVKDLGVLTGPVLFMISWLLFGVYEIGYSIEDPFQGSLRLSIISDSIRRDVIADEFIRESAFQLENSDSESSSGTGMDDYDDDDDMEGEADDYIPRSTYARQQANGASMPSWLNKKV
mmetsp:Transcript_19980/g.29608  ORF Transcript_19980/g.29608 Transcript_19980/m.29608 type:complete len:518 (-) Transcript_19980:59-1612(-)|eukprot:CAMPEP_0194049126 /NCGR_PEP_ID=MMETSP0009_2-20130614/29723_1 /TAXON_ID=210454 /ORGANISM="Grammatophora oceanica, Strain CCMP 410" /LENGTH=517 /DNA_ID=CAMNT_0038695203 /DNA_START=138 /DNA_END=1691 /DNA_ORIENTATION=-